MPDGDRLLWFLDQCSRLTSLIISRDFLSESFLNQLPMRCSQLKELCILEGDSKTELDLSPVYELKSLFSLEIRNSRLSYWPVDVGLLFEKCRYLILFDLKYIEVRKRTYYHVYTFSKADLTNPKFWPGLCRFEYKERAYRRENLIPNLNKIVLKCKKYLKTRKCNAKKARTKCKSRKN